MKYSSTENSGKLKRSEEFFIEKAAEQYTGTFIGDGVTGAPVTELEYKHL